MSAPVEQTTGTEPVDTTTMRETAARVLGPESETDAPLPAHENLDILIGQLRDLELFIPEVEKMLIRMSKEGTARYCASACAGEARGKLTARPGRGPDGEVEYARRLARVVQALLDHSENKAAPPS